MWRARCLMLALTLAACAHPQAAVRQIGLPADLEAFATHLLIIQIPIHGDWGSDGDVEVRYSLERDLQRRLGTLGVVDGGDIGSGNMNLFVVSITDLPGALLAVKSVMERWDLLGIAVIQRSSFWSADDDEPVESVVWPIGYQGTFSVF